MTQLIALRRIGATRPGTTFEVADSDSAAHLIASGHAIEVAPLAGPGAHEAVRHRAAQDKEEAAVRAAIESKTAAKGATGDDR